MKKYERLEISLLSFDEEDIVRTSSADNVETMPDFPEDFEG